MDGSGSGAAAVAVAVLAGLPTLKNKAALCGANTVRTATRGVASGRHARTELCHMNNRDAVASGEKQWVSTGSRATPGRTLSRTYPNAREHFRSRSKRGTGAVQEHANRQAEAHNGG